MPRGRKAAPATPSNRIENPTQPEFGFDNTPLAPPYDPRTLLDIVEATGALAASIESIVTNTDLRGHVYRPTVDLSAADIDDQIEAAVDFRDGTLATTELSKTILKALGDDEPSVKAEKERIQATIRREGFILKTFFDYCNPTETFVKIREKTRRDLEITGNGYWEMIRDKKGKYQQINWIPSYTMRLHRTDAEAVLTTETIMVSPVQFQQRSTYRHFRRFVQGHGEKTPVYFKEAGDPRLMSSVTGNFYATEEEMREKESNHPFRPATEVIHFAIHSSTSPYGIPRWIGELVNIQGLKSADVVNNDYFNKKTLPPYIIKISGGRMEEDEIERLSKEIEDMCMGRSNWHKPMFMQVQPSQGVMNGLAAPAHIDLVPLTNRMATDGQFLQYSEASTDRIGASFRLPRLVRGDSRDMTRATANATLKFAEQQVFLPIRQGFDDTITKVILSNLGVYYHRFESRGPELTDPVELIQMLHKSFQGGYLLPDEIRNLAEQAYGIPFREIEAGWSDKPTVLVQAGLVAKTHDLNGEPVIIEPPEGSEAPPTDPNGSPAPAAKAPKKPDSADEVTKSWVYKHVEQQVEDALEEHDQTRIAELVDSLKPYFKEK